MIKIVGFFPNLFSGLAMPHFEGWAICFSRCNISTGAISASDIWFGCSDIPVLFLFLGGGGWGGVGREVIGDWSFWGWIWQYWEAGSLLPLIATWLHCENNYKATHTTFSWHFHQHAISLFPITAEHFCLWVADSSSLTSKHQLSKAFCNHMVWFHHNSKAST